MVNRCCVKNCKSQWKVTQNVSFHGVPLNPELREKFMEAIPLRLRPNSVHKYSKVCSKHFTSASFHPVTPTSVGRVLKRGAIPAIFGYDVDSSESTPTNKALKYEPLTSNTIVVFDEKKPSNNDSAHFKVEQCSCGTKQNVGVQTTMEQCNSVAKKDCATQIMGRSLPPTPEVVELRKTINILRMRLQRRENRINSMSNIIEHLKQNAVSTETVQEVLYNNLSGFSFDIFRNELRNSCASATRKRYDEEVKNFALTLYAYSPKAYKFVRSKLSLPHEGMLRGWIAAAKPKQG